MAVIAVLLQTTVLVIAPSGGGRAGRTELPGTIDYTRLTPLAIPALESSFVAKVLGRDLLPPTRPLPPPVPPASNSRGGAAPARTPTPAPPAPTPGGGRPLIPGATQVRPSMTVSGTAPSRGDLITYSVVARNDNDAGYTGIFTISTHTPVGTAACETPEGDAPVCVTPGEYDGSSQASGDPHVNPGPQTRAATIPAHSERTLYSLRVQVLATTPSGTVLHNHAHVSVAGAGEGAVTYQAPDVTVQ